MVVIFRQIEEISCDLYTSFRFESRKPVKIMLFITKSIGNNFSWQSKLNVSDIEKLLIKSCFLNGGSMVNSDGALTENKVLNFFLLNLLIIYKYFKAYQRNGHPF